MSNKIKQPPSTNSNPPRRRTNKSVSESGKAQVIDNQEESEEKIANAYLRVVEAVLKSGLDTIDGFVDVLPEKKYAKFKERIVFSDESPKRRNRVRLSAEEKQKFFEEPELFPNFKLITKKKPKLINQDSFQDISIDSSFRRRILEESGDDGFLLLNTDSLAMSPPMSPNSRNNGEEEDKNSPAYTPSSPSTLAFRQHIIKRALRKRIGYTRLELMIADSECLDRSLEEEIRDLRGQIALLEFENRQRKEKSRFNIDSFSYSLTSNELRPNHHDVSTDPRVPASSFDKIRERIIANKQAIDDASRLRSDQRQYLASINLENRKKTLESLKLENDTLQTEIDRIIFEIRRVKKEDGESALSPEELARFNVEKEIAKQNEELNVLNKRIEESGPIIRNQIRKVNDLRVVLELKNKELAEGQKKGKPDVPKLWKTLEATRNSEKLEREKLKLLIKEEEELNQALEVYKSEFGDSAKNSLLEEIESLKAEIQSLKSSFEAERSVSLTKDLTTNEELRDFELRMKRIEKEKKDIEKKKATAKVMIDKYKRLLQQLRITPLPSPSVV